MALSNRQSRRNRALCLTASALLLSGITLFIYGLMILPTDVAPTNNSEFASGAHIQWNSTISSLDQQPDQHTIRIQSRGFLYTMIGTGLLLISLIFLYKHGKNMDAEYDAQVLPYSTESHSPDQQPSRQPQQPPHQPQQPSRQPQQPSRQPQQPSHQSQQPQQPSHQPQQPSQLQLEPDSVPGIKMHYLQPPPITHIRAPLPYNPRQQVPYPYYYPPAYRNYYAQNRNI